MLPRNRHFTHSWNIIKFWNFHEFSLRLDHQTLKKKRNFESE